jgi:hypothetical protein
LKEPQLDAYTIPNTNQSYSAEKVYALCRFITGRIKGTKQYLYAHRDGINNAGKSNNSLKIFFFGGNMFATFNLSVRSLISL